MKASASMATFARKKPIQDVFRGHMASFVRRVVGYTPPSNDGGADAGDKARGEAAIVGDVSLTLEVMPESALAQIRDFHGSDTHTSQEFKNKKGQIYLEDKNHILWTEEAALAFHLAKRLPSTGRPASYTKNGRADRGTRRREYNGPGRHKADDIGLVTAQVKAAVIRMLQKGIGQLAAGWNEAAARLGVKLPSWITRHGGSYGTIVIVSTPTSLRITITNSVPYADHIPGFQRRVQAALNDEARSLERQVEATMKRLARQAGFK